MELEQELIKVISSNEEKTKVERATQLLGQYQTLTNKYKSLTNNIKVFLTEKDDETLTVSKPKKEKKSNN